MNTQPPGWRRRRSACAAPAVRREGVETSHRHGLVREALLADQPRVRPDLDFPLRPAAHHEAPLAVTGEVRRVHELGRRVHVGHRIEPRVEPLRRRLGLGNARRVRVGGHAGRVRVVRVRLRHQLARARHRARGSADPARAGSGWEPASARNEQPPLTVDRLCFFLVRALDRGDRCGRVNLAPSGALESKLMREASRSFRRWPAASTGFRCPRRSRAHATTDRGPRYRTAGTRLTRRTSRCSARSPRARAALPRRRRGRRADVHVGVVADWWVLGERRVVSTTGLRRGSRRRYGARSPGTPRSRCASWVGCYRGNARYAAAGRVRRGPTPDREHDRRETSGGDPRARSVGSRVPVVVRGAARQVPANAPERTIWWTLKASSRSSRTEASHSSLPRAARRRRRSGRREDAQAKAGSFSFRRARRGDENVGLPQVREPRGRGRRRCARPRKPRWTRAWGTPSRRSWWGTRPRALAGADDARRGGRRKKRRNKLLPPRAVAGGRSALTEKYSDFKWLIGVVLILQREPARACHRRVRARIARRRRRTALLGSVFGFFCFFKPRDEVSLDLEMTNVTLKDTLLFPPTPTQRRAE